MPIPNYFTCTLGEATLLKRGQEFSNINDFVQYNADEHPDLPAAGFYLPPTDSSTVWNSKVFTFLEIFQGSCATAEIISEDVNIPDQQTVALLCPSTAAFLFTWLALMRLGHSVLLIAPQCSPTAVAALCKQCKAAHIYHDDLYEELALNSAGAARSTEWILDAHSLPFVRGHSPFEMAQRQVNWSRQLPVISKNDIAYFHHTSGTSSGLPKPISQTHFAAAGAYASFDGSRHATFTATPLYHGGIADLFRAWTSKALIWFFPGKEVPITAANIVKCLDISRQAGTPYVKYFSSVPYVLQMMALDDRGCVKLKEMDIVGVGGAALPIDIGSSLVVEGVNLISRFGSAECGFLMSSHREYEKDKEWQYLRAGGGSRWLRFDERDCGLCELIILPGWPHMSKTNREDGSFATSDLFQRHPVISDIWKYDSRADSQLTLVTGKKFDPAPLESAIAAKSSLLQDVLIFGNGKPHPGALLFRSFGAKDLSQDDILVEIAPVVKKLNLEGQSHTQLSLNMLITMPYERSPLEKSSKGTVLRGIAEERYVSEIRAAYNGMVDKKDIPDETVEDTVLEIVRSVVTSSNGQTDTTDIGSETDLFTYGVDSIACAQIRHAVSRLLPQGSPLLPLTIVQDSSSVGVLSAMILDRRHGRKTEKQAMEDESKSMRDFVEKYSKLVFDDVGEAGTSPLTHPHSPKSSGKIVLLTGPTGSLGSHVLDQLVKSPLVSHIHLLLRGATQKAAEERVRKAFFSKRLAVPPDFHTKVSTHLCVLSQPHLGLPVKDYMKLMREVDTIFHLAWSVDFMLPLQGFKQHFAGLKTLLTMSLAHGKYTSRYGQPKAARFIFCSSIASVASFQKYSSHCSVPEATLDDPRVSGDIGYSRSKWVAENICSEAAKAHPELRAAISLVRVGQLSGDTVNGVWNKNEAYPLMLSSVKVTGCLPDLSENSVDWLPVDIAATAFLELGLCNGVCEHNTSSALLDGRHVQVYHLLNWKTPTSWSLLLKWLQKAEPFEVVKPLQWLQRLEGLCQSESEPKPSHPSLKLLSFWKQAYGAAPGMKKATTGSDTVDVENSSERSHNVAYELQASLRAMPALKTLSPVDEAYALKLWSWIWDSL